MVLPITMLACARIGAIHLVVYAGFSVESLAQRIVDGKPKVVITSNSVKRGSKVLNLKVIIDAVLDESAQNGVSVVVYADPNHVAYTETATDPLRIPVVKSGPPLFQHHLLNHCLVRGIQLILMTILQEWCTQIPTMWFIMKQLQTHCTFLWSSLVPHNSNTIFSARG